MRKRILIIPITAFLYGCGPSESDAIKAGFSNAAEMKIAIAEGYKTKAEAVRGEVSKLGFQNEGQMNRARSLGANNYQDYEKLSENLGFSSVNEMDELTLQGYRSKIEFIRATNSSGPLTIPDEYIDPPNTYWIEVSSLLNDMDKSEPMTKCSKFIDYEKTGEATALFYRFDKKGYKWVWRTPKNSSIWKNSLFAEMARDAEKDKPAFEVIRFDSRGENKLKVTFRTANGTLNSHSYKYEPSRQVRYLTEYYGGDNNLKAFDELKRMKIKSKIEQGQPGLRQILCQN
jgi:hypothetical protein